MRLDFFKFSIPITEIANKIPYLSFNSLLVRKSLVRLLRIKTNIK